MYCVWDSLGKWPPVAKPAKLECLEHGTRGKPDDRTGNVLGMRYPVYVLIV